MKLPQTCIPKKENQEEIERLIKKTLVEKILADDLGKQVKEYLENQEISRRFSVRFEQIFDPRNYLDTDMVCYEDISNRREKRKKISIDLQKLALQEINGLLKDILKLNSGIKEEEIILTGNYQLSIITQEVISKLRLYERILFKKDEEKKGKSFSVYEFCSLKGKAEYLKFNKEYNEKLIKVLQNRGYDARIDFKELE